MANEPQDVDSILCAAIEIGSADQQAAYLDAACGGDAELRAQVEKLLTAAFSCRQFPGTADRRPAADGGHERADGP